MAKEDKSLTTMASPDDKESGEQNFVNLHRDNTIDALKNTRTVGDTVFKIKTKVFDRAKKHFGNDLEKSIADYDKRVSESINSHRLVIGGLDVGVFHGEGKEAAKYAHRVLKKHGKVKVTKEDIIAELTGKGKISDLAKHYAKTMDDKMEKAAWGNYDERDPDKHGELSFHNSMRAFHIQQGNKEALKHGRYAHGIYKKRAKTYAASLEDKPKGSGYAPNGSVGHFDESEINEISSQLLGRYIKKSTDFSNMDSYNAGAYDINHGKYKLLKKVKKRIAGMKKATNKLVDRTSDGSKDRFKIESEINELSTQLLSRYRIKANDNVAKFGIKGDADSLSIAHKSAKGSALATKKIRIKYYVGEGDVRKKYLKVMPGQTRPIAVGEHLGSTATPEDYIHDFVHSDNTKFAGKSKKERIKMALGAYYGKHESEIENSLVEKFEENLPWVKFRRKITRVAKSEIEKKSINRHQHKLDSVKSKVLKK